MTKNIEIITFDEGDVKITIKIDYNQNTLSLVERNGSVYLDKQWLFAERTPDYFNGWRYILDEMKKAIEYGEEQLKEFNDERMKEDAMTLCELDKKLDEKICGHSQKNKKKK